MHRHVISDGTSDQSTIHVGRGLTPKVVEALDGRRQAALLCQPTTADLADSYGSALEGAGVTVSGYTLPDGESAKSLSVVEEIYRSLNRAHFTRDDVVVAVGGGALTDVAGFVAATYLRGIDAIYVPTTLLGAVDAAVGGKTAVNVDGKNLAGVFAHPTSVFIDIDTIDRLPDIQKMVGSAEAIKTGFIADMAIVELYEASGLAVDFEEVVNRSVAVKVAVVNDDFTEQGRRAILNYGHTVGHAIETIGGMSHGEAVAIGMVAAGAASHHDLSFDGNERQRDVLARVGLPVIAPQGMPAESVRAQMALDKKRDASGIRMVLLEAFERPVVVTVSDATVASAFEGIGLAS